MNKYELSYTCMSDKAANRELMKKQNNIAFKDTFYVSLSISFPLSPPHPIYNYLISYHGKPGQNYKQLG